MDYTVHVWDKAKMLLQFPGYRIFTMTDEVNNHYKFWGIKSEGQETLTTVWGRIGKKPQYKTEKVSSYRIHSEAQRKINSKLNKGYVELCEE